MHTPKFKDNQPLVSIAMTTYNGEKFLIKQLDSLVNQTYHNIEIIIVDDCSSDKTLNILNQYSKENSNIQILANEKNIGLHNNFEKALKHCKGDYIALCDQDDFGMLKK
jgi:glycosyltransferase involved in cell wall biosynthesis